MLAYKGFDKGLICRDYQFKMGLNITEKANCVKNGFHCAENPLDCLTYYPSISKSEYYIVDAGGDIDEDNCDSKISCTHLNIIKRLTLKEFFLHALAYVNDHPFREDSHNMYTDKCDARNGYAVVRGKNPIARGSKGDIICFAKEAEDSKKISQIAIYVIDGKKVLPNKWYNIDLEESEGVNCD